MGEILQAIVLMLAKANYYLIIDDVSFRKKQVDKWKKILHSFSVLWVGVNAPLAILEEREKNESNKRVVKRTIF